MFQKISQRTSIRTHGYHSPRDTSDRKRQSEKSYYVSSTELQVYNIFILLFIWQCIATLSFIVLTLF